MGPRPIRPQRFGTGPLVAGFGLLSLLVVIVIMAMMATRILDDTGGVGPVDDAVPMVPDAADGPDTADGPDAADGPDGAGDQTADGQRPGALDAATAAGCRIDKQTIETAVSVFEAVRGESPTSIADLIDESLLREDTGTFELRPGAEGVEVVGVGVCEGTD